MKKKNYTPSRSNFQTHKLQFSQSSIKLRPSYKSFLFFGIFAAVGTLIFIIGAIQLPAKDLFGLFIWFALFGGAGFYGIFKTFYKKYPVIDLINNIFYPEGKISKYMIHDDSGIPLKELKKINVERIYHRGSKSSYYYYTLYLDFGNERIFPFLGHGALKLFVQDADKLSSILNIPITPEDEYKSWISPAKERKNALAMLIFGTVWTLITAPIMYSLYQNEFSNSNPGDLNEKWRILVLAIFPAVGLLMIISATFSLLKKENSRK